MEYRSTVRDHFLRQHLDQSLGAEKLKAALAEFDQGNADEGHEILRPLLDSSNPCAFLLASMFSMESESEQAFVERHLLQTKEASALGGSFAMYSLGVYFDQGELLNLDKDCAFVCFRKSAELGMPRAMFVYGVMLYYGTGGASLQRPEGLSLVQAAASTGVDEAIEFLNFLNRGKSGAGDAQ